MNIIGEVNGKNVILIDDMIDTAGTITNAASALKERGAKEVYASCSHPVLSGPAIDRLNASPITELSPPTPSQLRTRTATRSRCSLLRHFSVKPSCVFFRTLPSAKCFNFSQAGDFLSS